MLALGPVPSRCLGWSLGINNIPPKICTYSCVYCQLGRTHNMKVERKEFYKAEEILHVVEKKSKKQKKEKNLSIILPLFLMESLQLDINLAEEIKLLKPLGIKIAIITNSSTVRDSILIKIFNLVFALVIGLSFFILGF